MFSVRAQRPPTAGVRQQGVTLIEALAAFVILSVGLLGIVSLQALSKGAQHQGIQRARAVMLANDLVERIRINPGGVEVYSDGGLVTALGGGSIATAPNPDCAAVACNPTQMASYDLWVWEQSLDGASVTVTEDGVTSGTGGLMQPQACVVFEADGGKSRTGVVEVIIQWRGLTSTSDAVESGGTVCGDEDDGGGGNLFRRQIVASTYVIDEAEL